ncbi:28S ribosomal protein S31, mitochondrial isoform X1 [Amblyraja radiata]|uniref:28S ribosomal protein S31, mitochondrial isoform X1 n=1 Tax=Amblyraja radiata TaxID=386614 RepID=UPI001402621C|nr:28S ribosomal protein S31, mitochondrial isoform X1 [Amblyraja radiata]
MVPMQRVAALGVGARGTAGLLLLTGAGGRWIFTASAALRKEHEPPQATSPVQPQDAEETEAAPPGKAHLLNLIGGMKVEVSSKRKFQALRLERAKARAKAEPEELESTSSMFQKAAEERSTQSGETVSRDLAAAASAVASSMPRHKAQVESELLQQLRKHESETEAHRHGDARNIGDIIANMKIGRAAGTRAATRATSQIRFDDDGQGFVHHAGITSELSALRKRKELYTGRRLNIFPAPTESENLPGIVLQPSLWDVEQAGRIAAVTEHLPRNGFEEMIQWTKEGKLRHFPIDNEAGLEEEEGVEFHEHVFLDKHLHGFPEEGSIRHFIDLVANGLSKNPYLSVQRKIEHIDWFRQYFHQKQDVLTESEVYVN